MKMNELGVFNAPVYLRGNTIGHQWGDYARFSNEQQARAAAHAINNHDRMVEEIAELKGAIDGAINIGRLWLPSSYSVENREEDKAIYNMHSEFIRLLLRDDSDGSEQESKEKLNQKGGE